MLVGGFSYDWPISRDSALAHFGQVNVDIEDIAVTS
jgi:hypothetical protein